jgi:hypothetical protein
MVAASSEYDVPKPIVELNAEQPPDGRQSREDQVGEILSLS